MTIRDRARELVRMWDDGSLYWSVKDAMEIVRAVAEAERYTAKESTELPPHDWVIHVGWQHGQSVLVVKDDQP